MFPLMRGVNGTVRQTQRMLYISLPDRVVPHDYCQNDTIIYFCKGSDREPK
jgi:hypothetical protein